MRTRRLVMVLALGLGLTLVLLAGLHSARAEPTASDRFVTTTGSGSACSQAAPCALPTALGLAVHGDTIYVAGGVYTGTGTEVVAVTKSVRLIGGWNGLTGGLVVDPAAYPTTLDGERARRVVVISGNITPTLDGFIVTRGNATGQLYGCPSNPDGCGGGIYALGAHPIIVNNSITNNVAAITTTGNPTVAIGYGGGLYLANTTRAVIRGNLVISNAASTAYYGMGGGLYLSFGAGAQVQFNQVLSNAATTVDAPGYGGGIYGGPDGVLIQGNVVAGNRTNSTGTGAGAGLFQYGGNAHYLGNLVQGNSGPDAVKLQYSRARFESNRVVGNATDTGICLISGAGDGATLVNNVVAGSGSRAFSAYGYDATHLLTATLLHNTLVGTGSGYGVYASHAALVLTNTIVASTTWGITNTTPASAALLVDHTLFWANANNGLLGTNPVLGQDPVFVNPAGGDYHLDEGSGAIEAGVAAGVWTDMDGQPRPVDGDGDGFAIPDIGADEWQLPVYLPLVVRNSSG